ncbi:MAG: DUF488 family protein [Clostridiales bacterium]|nr:DUF488 family protein [Clostridiales bacterium]
MAIQIKRVYAPRSDADGCRVLVDRLWPRGVSREAARLDEWMKDVAPSPGLRAWFGHKAENFDQFADMYRAQLAADPEKRAAADRLIELGRAGTVTLLYAAHSETINHAAVLQSYLRDRT